MVHCTCLRHKLTPVESVSCLHASVCVSCRDPAKMELVREIAMDGVLYMPGPEEPTHSTDLSKAACLNRVLRKIYPRGTEPKATDLIAFLDDDQVGMQVYLYVKCMHCWCTSSEYKGTELKATGRTELWPTLKSGVVASITCTHALRAHAA